MRAVVNGSLSYCLSNSSESESIASSRCTSLNTEGTFGKIWLVTSSVLRRNEIVKPSAYNSCCRLSALKPFFGNLLPPNSDAE